jgi:hypothetical protein
MLKGKLLRKYRLGMKAAATSSIPTTKEARIGADGKVGSKKGSI